MTKIETNSLIYAKMTKIETNCLKYKMTKIEINLLYINYKNRAVYEYSMKEFKNTTFK